MTLRNQLNTLEASGLIHLAAAQPELQYLFRHALVQEAAYASLVKADRRILHQAVGEALERFYPDQHTSRELAPLLAQHFAAAGDDDRALKYFTLAGDAAAQVYANAEAVLHYARAIEIAKRNPPLPMGDANAGEARVKDGLLIHLYTRRGRALELLSHYHEAMDSYHEMESLAKARADEALQLAALAARITLHTTPSPQYDAEQGEALAARALTLAHALGDRQSESKILWNLLMLNTHLGQVAQAIEYGEQSAALARELNLKEQLAFTLNDLARAYSERGQLDYAQALREEARALWRELGNLPMLTNNLGDTSVFHYLRGNYAQAQAEAQEGYQVSQRAGNLWGQGYSRSTLGYIYFDSGEISRALAMMKENLHILSRSGLTLAAGGLSADLAWMYRTLGDVERGRELAQQARGYIPAPLPPLLRSWTKASLARFEILEGNLAQAEAYVRDGYVGLNLNDFYWTTPITICLAEAELALTHQDFDRARVVLDELLSRLAMARIRAYVPDALYLKSQTLLAQGLTQSEDVRAALTEARATAEALNSRRSLWLILATLSQIETKHGNHAAAQSLFQQARTLVTFIADQIDTPELRASFLSLPNVQAVLK